MYLKFGFLRLEFRIIVFCGDNFFFNSLILYRVEVVEVLLFSFYFVSF